MSEHDVTRLILAMFACTGLLGLVIAMSVRFIAGRSAK